MAKQIFVKNLTNRTLELIFGETSKFVAPRSTSEAIAEKEWKGSFAEKQVLRLVDRHEARIIEKGNAEAERTTNNVVTETAPSPVKEEAVESAKEAKNNNKKGDK